MDTTAFGVIQENDFLEKVVVTRRVLTDFDVLVKILYCGVCHSDKHHIDNDWDDSVYPLVPGHEIVGVVENIGSKVTNVIIGDHVAIGNMTDSCQLCTNCILSKEQYCLNGGPTWTYNSKERINENGRSLRPSGKPTYGGYSGRIVSQEKFVFKLPDSLDLAKSAPLLCAGITMYHPLKKWNIGKNHTVGIAGIGGLGHLGIKFAKALGAKVIALTTTKDKLKDCISLGADDAILMSKDFMNYINIKHKVDSQMPINEEEAILFYQSNYEKSVYMNQFDFIIDTIPVTHDITAYLNLLKPESNLHIVGNMNYFHLKGIDFVFSGKNITSSNVGGLYDTREMLNFCSEKNIQANIKLIKPSQINEAICQMVNKNIRYRFVLDLTVVY